MPTTIKLKNSVTTTNAPSSLVQGEVAINVTDRKVWVGNAANTPVQLLGTGATGNFSALTCTTLSASGATTFTAGTASTSTTTGTAVITGGLGVSGRINAANFDGIVGANTAAAGNFTTLGASGVATFSAGAVGTPAITTTGDTNTGIFFPAADTIAFTEGGVESMRIDSSGNVAIGTTTTTNAKFTVVGSTGGTGGIRVETQFGASYFGNYNNYPAMMYDGASLKPVILYDLNNNANILYTNNTERMRIDSSGNLLVGTTTAQAPITAVAASGGAMLSLDRTSNIDATLRDMVQFRRSVTSVGSITCSDTLTAYNTTSDYRLKTVIGNVTGAGQRIDALEPIEYDWKNGGRTKGFLAHKFAEVYPNSVSGEKDAVDKNGKPVYQNMQASTSEVMADLIAEIQSLRKRVAQLESK